MMVTFDRGDYWQCAYVIAKGTVRRRQGEGLPALLDDVVRAWRRSSNRDVADVKSWDDVKLLTVAIDRLQRWHRAGSAVHRRRRARDVAGRRRRRQPRGAGRGRQPPISWRRSSPSGCPPEDELDAVRRRRENFRWR